MTEELSQDKIKMVNKTNKKITIKHYLNTYVRPIVGNEDTEKEPLCTDMYIVFIAT